jgi:hypothetical protein
MDFDFNYFFAYLTVLYKLQKDSSVSIVLGYGLDDWGSRV